MSEKPILFNTEMVRAILDGRKTQTRRPIKPRYHGEACGFRIDTNIATGARQVELTDADDRGLDQYVKPAYMPGDLLYVRETWNYGYVDSDYKECCAEEFWFEELDWKGKDYEFLRGISRFWYLSDDDEPLYGLKWKPSIHMPKEAARIWLRVSRVGIEHLREITEESAIMEGFQADENFTARERFAMTWNSAYGVAGKHDPVNWASDPWVWVYEFERVSK